MIYKLNKEEKKYIRLFINKEFNIDKCDDIKMLEIRQIFYNILLKNKNYNLLNDKEISFYEFYMEENIKNLQLDLKVLKKIKNNKI